MNREKRPFDKSVDLHESEWSKANKKEPILGRNGLFFCIMLPLGLIIGWAFSAFFDFMVTFFDFWAGLAIGAAIAALFIWLLLEPLINACFWLVDWTILMLRRR